MGLVRRLVWFWVAGFPAVINDGQKGKLSLLLSWEIGSLIEEGWQEGFLTDS